MKILNLVTIMTDQLICNTINDDTDYHHNGIGLRAQIDNTYKRRYVAQDYGELITSYYKIRILALIKANENNIGKDDSKLLYDRLNEVTLTDDINLIKTILEVQYKIDTSLQMI